MCVFESAICLSSVSLCDRWTLHISAHCLLLCVFVCACVCATELLGCVKTHTQKKCSLMVKFKNFFFFFNEEPFSVVFSYLDIEKFLMFDVMWCNHELRSNNVFPYCLNIQ